MKDQTELGKELLHVIDSQHLKEDEIARVGYGLRDYWLKLCREFEDNWGQGVPQKEHAERLQALLRMQIFIKLLNTDCVLPVERVTSFKTYREILRDAKMAFHDFHVRHLTTIDPKDPEYAWKLTLTYDQYNNNPEFLESFGKSDPDKQKQIMRYMVNHEFNNDQVDVAFQKVQFKDDPKYYERLKIKHKVEVSSDQNIQKSAENFQLLGDTSDFAFFTVGKYFRLHSPPQEFIAYARDAEFDKQLNEDFPRYAEAWKEVGRLREISEAQLLREKEDELQEEMDEVDREIRNQPLEDEPEFLNDDESVGTYSPYDDPLTEGPTKNTDDDKPKERLSLIEAETSQGLIKGLDKIVEEIQTEQELVQNRKLQGGPYPDAMRDANDAARRVEEFQNAFMEKISTLPAALLEQLDEQTTES